MIATELTYGWYQLITNEIINDDLITDATILLGSEALAGKINVLELLAKFPKASTYCSATDKAAALPPSCAQKNQKYPTFSFNDLATNSIADARACAFNFMACDSPCASLIACCIDASDAKMADIFLPSATLISACLTPKKFKKWKKLSMIYYDVSKIMEKSEKFHDPL
uniref:Uncharacterized protein n=1 Tax=Romanomermis culicivorax TaxID=13658 RepID=A0A915IFZ2_ROMCU